MATAISSTSSPPPSFSPSPSSPASATLSTSQSNSTSAPEHRDEQLLLSHHAAASSTLRYSAVHPVQIDGWLAKEGKALRSRRTRFLRLNSHILSSHRSKSSPPSWQISIADAIVERGHHPREIKLSVPHRSISLVAPSQTEFHTWIVALRRASIVSSRVDDYYTIGRLIGEGMNGQVRLAHDMLTNDPVAVKMVPRLGRENETQFLAREVQIILSVNHPNIVNTVDVFVTRRRIHFVMEYLAGGELFDFIAENTQFTETHAATVMTDLLNALSYLHARGIAHRDVKLENLLCCNSSWPLNVKLADFGFANYVNSGNEPMLSSFVGTPYYIAPEMLRADPHGRPVDVWASGVVLYILLSGKFPFGGKNESEYYQRVLGKEAYFPSQEWANVSDDAKDLVRGMLCKDPAKRFTADFCLQHPWFKRSQVPPDVRKEENEPIDMDVLPPLDDISSPRMFRMNREKRTHLRHLGMLNQSLPHSVQNNGPVLASTRQEDPTPNQGSTNFGQRQRASSATPNNEGSRMASSTNLEDVYISSRRPSLIRRLLSSGKLSLDRYDGRFPTFRGHVEGSDEASATPRKTMSLFAKHGPFRRSFHRAGERATENSRPTPSIATNTPVDPGINFVNSQSQRLPPKLARERLRLQKQQAEANRRAVRSSGGGIFGGGWLGGNNSSVGLNYGSSFRVRQDKRSSQQGDIESNSEAVLNSPGYFSQHPHLHSAEKKAQNLQSEMEQGETQRDDHNPSLNQDQNQEPKVDQDQECENRPYPHRLQSQGHQSKRQQTRHDSVSRNYHSSPKLFVPSFSGLHLKSFSVRPKRRSSGTGKNDRELMSHETNRIENRDRNDDNHQKLTSNRQQGGIEGSNTQPSSSTTIRLVEERTNEASSILEGNTVRKPIFPILTR